MARSAAGEAGGRGIGYGAVRLFNSPGRLIVPPAASGCCPCSTRGSFSFLSHPGLVPPISLGRP